jgi:hypothetical protein
MVIVRGHRTKEKGPSDANDRVGSNYRRLFLVEGSIQASTIMSRRRVY